MAITNDFIPQGTIGAAAPDLIGLRVAPGEALSPRPARSIFAVLTGGATARRHRAHQRAEYLRLLDEDDYRLTDLGVTRLDVLRLLQDLDRS